MIKIKINKEKVRGTINEIEEKYIQTFESFADVWIKKNPDKNPIVPNKPTPVDVMGDRKANFLELLEAYVHYLGRIGLQEELVQARVDAAIDKYGTKDMKAFKIGLNK